MKTTPRRFATLLLALIVNFAAACSRGAGTNDAEAPQTVTSKSKQFEQKDHLFKITPPTGWRWNEQPGKIKILDPQTGNGISFTFGPTETHTAAELKELLKQNIHEVIDRFVKPSGGTVVKEEERPLGGVDARQLTFLQPLNGRTGTVTYIALFAKEHALTIAFGGSDTNQVGEMKKSVETIRFD